MKYVILIGLFLLIALISYTLKKSNKLKANGLTTTGTITNIRSAFKEQNKRTFDYTFIVDGVEYKGNVKGKRYGGIYKVGSEVEVLYEKGNPENSTVKLNR